jgi:hypothetical protein
MPHQASIDPGARQQSAPSPCMKRRWLFLLGGLFAVLQGCATAPPPISPGEEARTQAKIAYLLSDYQRTLAIALPRAEAGEAWAQYTLGYLYYYGRGVVQDRQTAKRWIESAAAKGYAPAQQAMQRLSTPPPSTGIEGEENKSEREPPTRSQEATPPPPQPETRKPVPAPAPTPPAPESSSSALPAERPEPTKPPMTEPSPDQPQETTPPSPSSEAENAAVPASPPPQDSTTTPAPPGGPTQPVEPSPPPAEPIPPRSSVPSSDDETAEQAAASVPGDDMLKGRDWISRQDPRHFTLQLASSIDEAAIRRLIHEQGIEQEAAYYSTTQGGRTWYSVVYGSFPTYTAARQSLSRLPRSLRRHSPRIRSFHAILSQLQSTTP